MATKHGHVSIELLDALGVPVSMPIYVGVDDTQTVATILTNAKTLGADVDSVTDSKITGVSVHLQAGIPSGAKSSPTAGAENERTGLLNFSQATGSRKFGVDIPAYQAAGIVDGKIDLSNAQLVTLLTALTSTVGGLTPESTSLYALVALLDALLSFRKHRKAESRRSLVVP